MTVSDELTDLAAALPLQADHPPLRIDEGGVVRVGDSRVSLDVIAWGKNTRRVLLFFDKLVLGLVASAVFGQDESFAERKSGKEVGECLWARTGNGELTYKPTSIARRLGGGSTAINHRAARGT